MLHLFRKDKSKSLDAKQIESIKASMVGLIDVLSKLHGFPFEQISRLGFEGSFENRLKEEKFEESKIVELAANQKAVLQKLKEYILPIILEKIKSDKLEDINSIYDLLYSTILEELRKKPKPKFKMTPHDEKHMGECAEKDIFQEEIAMQVARGVLIAFTADPAFESVAPKGGVSKLPSMLKPYTDHVTKYSIAKRDEYAFMLKNLGDSFVRHNLYAKNPTDAQLDAIAKDEMELLRQALEFFRKNPAKTGNESYLKSTLPVMQKLLDAWATRVEILNSYKPGLLAAAFGVTAKGRVAEAEKKAAEFEQRKISKVLKEVQPIITKVIEHTKVIACDLKASKQSIEDLNLEHEAMTTMKSRIEELLKEYPNNAEVRSLANDYDTALNSIDGLRRDKGLTIPQLVRINLDMRIVLPNLEHVAALRRSSVTK